MPKLKVLSGAEVVRILSIFGFKVASQRGSHIKLRRTEAGGGQQTLTIPNHKELDRGTMLRSAVKLSPRDSRSHRTRLVPGHCCV
jgi:predicted RNA binding protein YcfA (HicA-like mRNA interferase family)